MRRFYGLDIDWNIDKVTQRIGAQLGAIESVSYLKPLYEGALIVKVIDSTPISGSDHLSLCRIDDNTKSTGVERGKDGLIQVVCGASNVRAGMNTVWLPPGSIVPSSAAQAPLKITAKRIMNQLSNGMIASPRELNIGSDHSGIVELDDNVAIGSVLSDYLQLDDWVIDIENKMFTHRPDLFGQLGVARELTAIMGRTFKSPEWYALTNKLKSADSGKLSVTNQLLDNGCPRFCAVAIDNLKIGPSPLWLQSYLSRCGINPVNNIVDITNFVMISTAQPLHAYDLDKIAAGDKVEIVVRDAISHERLSLLDGTEIELNDQDIVIANSVRAIGLGGVMGGRDSLISENTKSIVLECANFDMYRIRRSSMSHGIFTEAVMRYTKGQSIWQCQPVLTYAFSLIKELCPDAKLASEVVDTIGQSVKPNSEVGVKLNKLESYLGIKLSPENIVALLTRVEIPARVHDDQLLVTPPFWRTDINEGVDIIEEVARLYGYDYLPKSDLQRPLIPPVPSKPIMIRQKLRHILAAAGANEVLTYSFVDSKLLSVACQDIQNAYQIANPLSPELTYYRLSLIPSLLHKVHLNHKAGFNKFALFEIGKTHQIGQTGASGLPAEEDHIALVVSYERESSQSGEAYYLLRTYLNYILGSLNIEVDLKFSSTEGIKQPALASAALPLLDGRSALISAGGIALGVIGEFSNQTRVALKLPQFCAGLELDTTALVNLTDSFSREYQLLSRYPKITQDLTLAAHTNDYIELYDKINIQLTKLMPDDVRYSLIPLDAYTQKNGSVNWTFRIVCDSNLRTLTDQELALVLKRIR
jgi:phenylalanyl-tRNA synthetase beta chain